MTRISGPKRIPQCSIERSLYFRTNFVPLIQRASQRRGGLGYSKAHFDWIENDNTERHATWKDNPNRFLLVGKPQVGKTGAVLWLLRLLWLEVYGTNNKLSRPEMSDQPDLVEQKHENGDGAKAQVK